MIGAIVGDIVGSVYEFDPIKTTEFPLFSDRSFFTDDTVLTVAVADAILKQRDYAEAIHEFANRYPRCSYGGMFHSWMTSSSPRPYGSFGNGSAMRVSPVGYAFDEASQVLREAQRTAEVTHSHPEGVKGAQATALAVFLGRTGVSQEDIRREVAERFGYDMSRSVDEIQRTYKFDETCQGTVPEAITAFVESEDFEDAIRKAISLGGDSDTIACIAGGIAGAFFGGVPETIESEAMRRLTPDLRSIVDEFCGRYLGS